MSIPATESSNANATVENATSATRQRRKTESQKVLSLLLKNLGEVRRKPVQHSRQKKDLKIKANLTYQHVLSKSVKPLRK